MKWKKLSSKSVYKSRWMEVTEDEIESEDGQKATFGVVRKKPYALIIPWDGQNVYLVGQYRYPVDEFSWEFPQGHFEHNSIEETAKEELHEETGLSAQNIKEIGQFFLAPGHHSQVCHIFLATGLKEGKQNLEESEKGMEVKKVTFEEFQELIVKGIIKDGPTIAALGMITAKRVLK